MQQSVDVIIKVLDALAPGLPSTGDINTILATILALLFMAGAALLLLSRPSKRMGGGAHKLALVFMACVLTASTVVISSPQAAGAPLDNTLTVTVTKDSEKSAQSIIAIPIDFDNAAGYGTALKISAPKSDLEHSSGTVLSPIDLADNTLGFALEANPAATPANKVVNGFAADYPQVDSATDLQLPFAGIDQTGGAAILENEVAGQGSANFYFSVKAASTLASGEYHVTLEIQAARYQLPATTSVAGKITFDDNDNQDGLRPSTVPIELWKTVGGVRTLTTETPTINTNVHPWTYSFSDLPVEEDGQAVTYDVKPGGVADYAPTQTDNDFTYKHIPGTISLSGKIDWSDNANAENVRPSTITLELLKSVGTGAPTPVTATAAFYDTATDSWTYSFDNLPKFQAGQALTYDAKAPDLAGYGSPNQTSNDFAYSHATGQGILLAEAMAGLQFLVASIPRASITEIVFSDSRPTGIGSVDVSVNTDGSVMAELNGSTLTIGSDGGVLANQNSSILFNNLNLTTLDLTHFHAERAITMTSMFASTAISGSITFSASFGSAATGMASMFESAQLPGLTELPASFGSAATGMASMFESAQLSGLTSFPNGFGSAATGMASMFESAQLSGLTSFPNGFGSMAVNMDNMFNRASLLVLQSFGTGFGSVTTGVASMFLAAQLPALTSFPDGFGSAVTGGMDNMFNGAGLPALERFGTGFGAQATSMASMFINATLDKLQGFPAGFGSVATNMTFMFSGVTLPSSLTQFPAGFGSQATTLSQMFHGATLSGNLDWSNSTFLLTGSPPLNVTNMFQACVFGSYQIMVIDVATQAAFAATPTGATAANITVKTP